MRRRRAGRRSAGRRMARSTIRLRSDCRVHEIRIAGRRGGRGAADPAGMEGRFICRLPSPPAASACDVTASGPDPVALEIATGRSSISGIGRSFGIAAVARGCGRRDTHRAKTAGSTAAGARGRYRGIAASPAYIFRESACAAVPFAKIVKLPVAVRLTVVVAAPPTGGTEPALKPEPPDPPVDS